MENPWCEEKLNGDSSGNNSGGLYSGMKRGIWDNYSQLFTAALTGTW